MWASVPQKIAKNNMEIAKGFKNTDYLNLNLEDINSPDYLKAIEIFEKRIIDRFIEPIDKLIEFENHLPSTSKKYGFIIISSDCMVLENLQSFYNGAETSDKNAKKFFVEFLTTRENFRTHFNDATAKYFFEDIRCGIIHQLETYRNSKIYSIGSLISEVDNGIIINRNLFHENLKKEFLIYTNSLKTSTLNRVNFKKKMDFICNR